MKKVFLIASICSLILCGVLLVIGLSNPAPERPTIQNPTFSTTMPVVPTEPLHSTPYDTLIPGNYYLIASTNTSPYLQRNYLEYALQNNHLTLVFYQDGTAAIDYNGVHITTYTERENRISFGEPDILLNTYPFEVEHDAEWIEQNQPENFETLTVEFNPQTQIISIKYGIDSMELKYFPSVEEAAKELSMYIPENSGIVMPDYAYQYDELTKYT